MLDHNDGSVFIQKQGINLTKFMNSILKQFLARRRLFFEQQPEN
jgi:hypothetical protein